MFHVLSASQFDRKGLEDILNRASEMEKVLAKGGSESCRGKILAALFYEPSTRTRLSFESAMLRLGGSVISETDVTFSSQAKGESLPDTIRVIDKYSDIIAIRSKHKGDAQVAADYSGVPILNGGDGSGEHPTQSLLDLFTISKYFSLDEKIRVTFIGDCKHCRTIHSLSKILRNFDHIEINFVAPEEVQIPEEYLQAGDQKFTEISENILKNSDVIYTQRIQKERFADPVQAEHLAKSFIFDRAKADLMHDRAILMDPLPRINTITFDVDGHDRAKYFEQAMNGVPVRMALIDKAING